MLLGSLKVRFLDCGMFVMRVCLKNVVLWLVVLKVWLLMVSLVSWRVFRFWVICDVVVRLMMS